jgi:NADH:ubiquinone oxidoreductase subunit F (NADH-binding)
VSRDPSRQRFLVCNGAEGEPATFKDRTLMRTNPYQLVEGVLIAALAIDAVGAFICVKASFTQEIDRLTRAIEEMQSAGLCRDCPVTIVSGPSDYLYGEEKAMLEVIEGKAPLPRTLPPYEHGLFVGAPQEGWEPLGEAIPGLRPDDPHPTVVNNVETLANVPSIVVYGAEWFRQRGTAESPGTVVSTIVGDVQRAGVAELDLGATTLRDAIEQIGGGPRLGHTIKAVLSGVSNRVVTSANLGVALSYEALSAIGSGLGAAGFWILDDSACMVAVALEVSRFLSTESCGQCLPCKLGCTEITTRLERLESGLAERQDLVDLEGWLTRVTDGNRCYLPVEEQAVVASIIAAFPDEVVGHMRAGGCPRPGGRALPRVVDIADGTVTLAINSPP